MLRIFLLIGFVLAPISAGAALKKQCKPELFVDAEILFIRVGTAGPPDRVRTKNAASYLAQNKWKTWAAGTHGRAYANPRLANRYKIKCQINGSPPKGVLCSVRGVPCRVNNAPGPSKVFNRVPARVLKKKN